MALRPIGSDKASDPLGLRQMKDWGRGVARALGSATGAQENRSGGGTVASEQVAWAHADGFRAYFKHREEYSTSSNLVVTAGRVHTAKKTEQANAASAEITLPSSGNLYVYVTYVMSATPTATITSNATQPEFRSAFATYNFVLGVLTETSTGQWSWASWREGDIFLDAMNYIPFPVGLTQTGGSAGDSTTACTFTYTVKDLAGNTIATGASPTWNRPAAGAMVAATHGLAYWDDAGAIVLYMADEVPDVEVCP